MAADESNTNLSDAHEHEYPRKIKTKEHGDITTMESDRQLAGLFLGKCHNGKAVKATNFNRNDGEVSPPPGFPPPPSRFPAAGKDNISSTPPPKFQAQVDKEQAPITIKRRKKFTPIKLIKRLARYSPGQNPSFSVKDPNATSLPPNPQVAEFDEFVKSLDKIFPQPARFDPDFLFK